MVFFKEWKDSKETTSILAVITVFFILITFGVYVNFIEESHNAMVYLIMAIIVSMTAVVDSYFEKGWIFAWNGFGTTKTQAISALFVGIAVMFVIVNSKTLSILTPLAAISNETMQFFYVVLAAPFIEEAFFRMAGVPTMVLLFKNLKFPYYDVVGMLFANVFFALFHGSVYGWNYPAMMAAFVFGILVSIGNQMLKSGAFGVGAHFINNYLLFVGR